MKTFVAPRRLLRVVTDFILFTRKDDELSKVVLRPHQMRAVERCVGRAKEPEKRRGLIWHTQGSGKTYTMITVAKRLIEDAGLREPHRPDARGPQRTGGPAVRQPGGRGIPARSPSPRARRTCRQLLKADRRGLIVSMIHKFDDIPANMQRAERTSSCWWTRPTARPAATWATT